MSDSSYYGEEECGCESRERMGYFVGIFVMVAIACVAVFAVYSVATAPNCVKSHEALMYHPAHNTWMWMGKTYIPIHHNSYSSVDTICDQYDR